MSGDNHTWGWHEDLENKFEQLMGDVKELNATRLTTEERLRSMELTHQDLRNDIKKLEANQEIHIKLHLEITQTQLNVLNRFKELEQKYDNRTHKNLDKINEVESKYDMVSDLINELGLKNQELEQRIETLVDFDATNQDKFMKLEQKLQYVIDNYLMEFEPALTKLKELEKNLREHSADNIVLFHELEEKLDSTRKYGNLNSKDIGTIEAVLQKIITTEIKHYSDIIRIEGAEKHPQWRDLIKRKQDWQEIDEQFEGTTNDEYSAAKLKADRELFKELGGKSTEGEPSKKYPEYERFIEWVKYLNEKEEQETHWSEEYTPEEMKTIIEKIKEEHCEPSKPKIFDPEVKEDFDKQIKDILKYEEQEAEPTTFDSLIYSYNDIKAGKIRLIAEFLKKILAFNYALPTEPQIIEIREWLEAKQRDSR